MNIATGRKVVASAGTAEPLSATNLPVARVIISAETNNTNPVVVGDANVVASLATRQGTPISPLADDDPSMIELFDVDLKDVYIDAVTSTEGVTFTYFY
jgi:hypothetical protein